MTVKLKYATIETKNQLVIKGVDVKIAEAMLLVLSDVEHDNVYSKAEIDAMLPETVKNVFVEMRTEMRYELEERRREFDKRMELSEKRFEDEIKELRAHKRWIVGTIITVGLAIIGYLQFIH